MTVNPGEDDLVTVSGPGQLEINLRIIKPESKTESEFKKTMEATFDRMPDSTNGFQEYRRKLFDINGHPAAYIEYKWNVMKNDFRVLELNVMKGQHQYVLVTTYLLKDDNNYLPAAQAVFDSFRLLDGEPDLTALKAEESDEASKDWGQSTKQQGSGGQSTESTKLVLAFTQKTCNEKMVLDTIRSEFGDQAKLADWTQLKQQYSDALPAELARLGLDDKEAAWVANEGLEFASGNRHYFIQRFDSNRPADFFAHDQVGTISLGSWYNMELPVLVVKNP